jgi:hypothetical protein
MKITLEDIKFVIEKETGYNINTKRRYRHLVDSRKMFYYIARKHTDSSLSILGKFLKRDHATALHNINSAKNLIETEPSFKIKLFKLEEIVLVRCKEKYKKEFIVKPSVIHPALLRYAKQPLRKVLNKRR